MVRLILGKNSLQRNGFPLLMLNGCSMSDNYVVRVGRSGASSRFGGGIRPVNKKTPFSF